MCKDHIMQDSKLTIHGLSKLKGISEVIVLSSNSKKQANHLRLNQFSQYEMNPI